MIITTRTDADGNVLAVTVNGREHVEPAVIKQMLRLKSRANGKPKEKSVPLPMFPDTGRRCWWEGAIVPGGACTSCGGNKKVGASRDRHVCHNPARAMTPTCHRDHIDGSTIQACVNCDYDDEVDISPATDVSTMRGLIRRPPPPQGWPIGWPEWANVKQAHWEAANEFLENLGPYPEGRYQGRGVTISGGGKYWASAYVSARMVRHWCNLPIQVWFLGDRERDERYLHLFRELGIECVDAEAHPARPGRREVAGFGSKMFAALNSPYEENLSLDGDCYPCSNPEVLFDDARYKEAGGIYWPDRDFTETWTRWPFWGVQPRGPKCGLETGQYVINKRLAWDAVSLTEWYDDHPDWCYGAPYSLTQGDYGDKGPPRAAWAKTGREYVVFNTEARHEQFAYVQPGPDGQTPMFIHRCHSKWSAEGPLRFPTTPQVHTENKRGGFPGEETAFGYLSILQHRLKSM